ncbi:MAG TPA: SDR family NAD(P)-dependent oxidoreductase [Steroidobacteraceae bacterium]|nr:SDR family NAD(P)-dependent oxidoreductase [Steroidobacteraceae bacterium]
MLLKNRTAIIYGAGGAIGGAVARTFAREGAKVFLSGRTIGKVERVAEAIVAAGGTAQAFEVDALDEPAVESHVAHVFATTGRLDVSFNAITAVRSRGPRVFLSPSCRSTVSLRRSPPICGRTI